MRMMAPVVLLALLAAGPVHVAAQDGVLAGTVVDVQLGTPVSGATIELVEGFGSLVTRVASDADGTFQLTAPAGRYAIVVTAFAYVTSRVDAVTVSSGANPPLSVSLEPQALVLNPIVLTVSRREQEAITAPAAVYVVRNRQIEERVAPTPADHIRHLPGVDASQASLSQSYTVTRGFNNVFTGSLLVLTDGRYAQLPSVRLNADYMIPANDLDIERIEMTLGPGAALYGPNAADGVMHIFTKSPIDHPGTSVSLAGGGRSLWHGMFRSAVAGESTGFKVSGEYFRGEDWRVIDPAEEAARAADPTNPLLGARDFTAERWSAEARFDARPDDLTEFIVTAGHNRAVSQLELTGVGRGQQLDYDYSFVQGRFRRDRLAADVFYNFIDSGDSRLLRTGQVAIDKSRLMAARLQHGADLGDRSSLLYGLDLQRTDPRTEGTINGRFEADDRIDEAGIYVQSETALSDRFRLVAAGRLDSHSRLPDPVFSPRVALSFEPEVGHSLRASFNRAFVTPNSLNLSLDLQAAAVPIIPGFIDYDIRAVGVPETGYTFAECAGGVGGRCMRSPMVPGVIAADGALVWDVLVGAIAPSLASLLPNPGAQVSSILRRLDLGAGPGDNPFPVDNLGAQEITPLVSTTSNTFEVGYNGLIGDKLLLSPSVYYMRFENFIGPINPETPQVFYDPTTTASYVNARLSPLVTAGVITQGDVDALVAGLVAIPLGTVSPEQWDSPDILLASRNFGSFNMWGWDVSARLLAATRLTLDGSLSYVSEDCLDSDGDGSCFGALDVALNASRFKGGIAATYQWPSSGAFANTRFRFVDDFPMNSGVYVGTVDAYTVVDVSAGVALPGMPGASVQLSASNVFDQRHREFVGAPELGRLLLLRLRYDF